LRKKNIKHRVYGEGSFFLPILSSMAEGESVSISDNSKWSIQKRFENGTFKVSYRHTAMTGTASGKCSSTQNKQRREGNICCCPFRKRYKQHWPADLNLRSVPYQAKPVNGHLLRFAEWLSNEKYVGWTCIFQKTFSDSVSTRHNNHGEKRSVYVF